MIEIIVSTDSDARRNEKEKVLKKNPSAHILDDSVATFEALRTYAHLSLFEEMAPTVVASFLLEKELPSKEGAQALAASPTQFFLFERTLSADAKKLFTKLGTITVLDGKSIKKTVPSLFYDASSLVVETDKRKRWMKLQALLQSEVPEAFIGIVYWKLRDLATKLGPNKENYKKMYDALITAHADAWIAGTPLANAIEKVLLTK